MKGITLLIRALNRVAAAIFSIYYIENLWMHLLKRRKPWMPGEEQKPSFFPSNFEPQTSNFELRTSTNTLEYTTIGNHAALDTNAAFAFLPVTNNSTNSTVKNRFMKSSLLRSSFFAIALLIANLFFVSAASAQTTGDYRSAGTGSWSTLATWQRWSGSAWLTPVAGEGYPGQLSVPGNVQVQNAHTVTLDVSPASAMGSLTVGSGASGILTIGNSTTNRALAVTGDVIVNAGATFQTAGDGGNTLALGGNLTIAGTLDMNIGAADLDVTFNGTTQTISGAGATADFNSFTVSSSSNTILTRTITIVSGTANGRITCSTGGTLTPSGTFTFGATGYYDHARDGGTIPSSTWNVASTCAITGTVSTSPTIANETFGHFIWNATGQTADISLAGSLDDINGNFTVTSTGSASLRLQNGGTGVDLDVLGNFSQTGGNFKINGGTSAIDMTVHGDFSLSGGTFDINGGTTLTCTLIPMGDFSITSPGVLTESGSTIANVNFNGGGQTDFTNTGSITNTINFSVTNNTTLMMGTSVMTGSGTFSIGSGETLGIGSAGGISISGATGNVQVTGTRTYSTGANYIYNGIVDQVVGNGLTQNTPDNVTIDNDRETVTLGANLNMTGDLVVSNGILDMVTFNISSPTSVTMTGTEIIGTGLLTLAGNLTTNVSPNIASITAPIALGAADRTFTIGSGPANPDLVISSVISGTALIDINKAGLGDLHLTGTSSTYLGITTISAGTLRINSIAAPGVASSIGAPAVAQATIVIAAGGTLQYLGTGHSSSRIFNISGTGGTINASGSGTLTLTGNITNNDPVLSGSGVGIFNALFTGLTNVTKTGTGTWTFGGVNTYTGNTNVNGGVLRLGASGRLADVSDLILTSPGIFDLAGFTETVAIVSGNGTITNSAAGASVITTNTTSSNTFSGIIENGTGGGTVSLVKLASGTFTLDGANTYTGPTIVTAGVLQLNADNTLSNTALNLNGGTFRTGITTGYNQTLGDLTLSATSTLALGTGSHTINFANSSANAWAGTTLTITGWTGTAGVGGTAGKIIAGVGGLSAAQLNKVSFTGFTLGAMITPSGELVPNTGVYYSQGNLAPNTNTNWNSVRTGGGLSPANFTSGNTFVIQDQHTMTTSAGWTISGGTASKLQIENGGTLISTFAVDLSSTTTFQIDNGGTYKHRNTGVWASTIFGGVESFANNSTVEINATATTMPTNSSYGNLVINFTSAPGGAISFLGNITSIAGNLSIQNTQNVQVALTTNTTSTLNLSGSLSVSGATSLFAFTIGSGVPVINVTGDVSLSSGTFNSNQSTLNVLGNWTRDGGTHTAASGTVTFNNTTAPQTISGTATSQAFNNLTINKSGQSLTVGGSITSLSATATLNVGAGTTLDAGTANITAGTFTTNASAIVEMGSNALTVTTASHAGLLRTQNTSATPLSPAKTWGGTVEYYGATQTVVSGTYNILYLTAAGTKTAGGTITATNLDNGGVANSASVLDMVGNALNFTTIDNTNGLVRFSGATNGKPVSTGTVEYYGGNQVLEDGNYATLMITGTGTKTSSGAGPLNVSVLLDNGGVTDLPVILDMGADVLTATSIDNTNATIRFLGASNGLAISTGTVDYAGGAQTVAAGTYNNLVTRNVGVKTAAGNITATSLDNGGGSNTATVLNILTHTLSAGTIDNQGASVRFSGTNNGFVIASGTVVYDGASQNIDDGTYENLTVAQSSGDASLTGATTVSGIFTMTSGNILGSGNLLQLGTSTSVPGSLVYTAGNIVGDFKRWINATGTGIRFPVGTVTDSRNALLTFSALTPGSVTAGFNNTDPGNTGLPLSENSKNIYDHFTEGYWSLVAGDALASSNYNMELTGAGFVSKTFNAETRILKRADGGGAWTLNGTHVAGAAGVAKRNGLSGFSEFGFGVTEDCPTGVNTPSPAIQAVCNNAAIAPITVSPIGGTAPFSYQWYSNTLPATTGGTNLGSADGAQTATYSPQATTTVGTTYYYCVIIQDGSACGEFTSTAASVTVTAVITSSGSSTAILCNGGTSTLTIVAAGGNGSYTYTVNPGALVNTTGVFSGLTAGTYNWSVTDGNNCIASTGSETISEPTLLTASSVQGAAILCNGGTTTVTVSAAGGTAPYTGEGTFTVGAGTYNYTVTDANGCTATTSITVTEPALVVASGVVTNVSCNGGTNGAIDLSVTGGSGSYTYLWSNSATTQDISGLAAGTYSVVITESNNCTVTGTVSFTVTESALVVASGVVTNVSCNGGTNGAIDLSVTGGSGSYTYLWSNSATTQDISGLAAGTYSVVITESNNCTVTGTVSFTVTEPTLLTASSVQGAAILCNGGTTTVTVSAAGGTAPYTGEGTFTVGAGTYNYTVTDANGCTATTSITVSEPTLLTASSVQDAAILCNGGTTTVTVSAAGGTAPYTGEGTFTVGAGTYNYTVTDANGCTATTSITVTEPALVVASGVVTNVSCNGGTTGSIDLTVTGGSGSYTYLWSNSATTQDISGLAAGTYSVVITESNNCTVTGTVSFTVTEPTLLTASSVQDAAILCNGGTTTVTVTATGGTAPYTGTGTFTVGAGTYNYTVTDANGCTATTSITVSEPTLLTASSVQDAAILCNGGTTTVTVSAAGGTAPYTGTGTFTVGAGTYNYTVTDANGCTATTSITVSEPALVVASGSVTNVSCNGGTNGAIDLSVTGGSGSYTYLWSNSATTQDISGLAAGTYSVVITESNNCTVTGTVSFTVSEPTLLTAGSVQDAAILCNGGTTTVTVSAAGGTAPYTGTGTFTVGAGTYNYTVTDANGCTATTSITVSEPTLLTASSVQDAAILCNGGTTTVTVTATGGTAPYTGTGTFTVGAGTYNYTVTDANGCTATTSITVSEPTLLTASSVQDAAILCNGGTTTVTVSAAGGTAPYTGTGTFTVGAGTYNYTVTDANGCTATTSITVSEPALVVASGSVTNVSCNGGTNGAIDLSVTGGSGSYTYLWSNSATTQDISGLAAGTYSVVITESNNCTVTGTVSFTVSEPTLLTAGSVQDAAILCNGGTTTVTVSAAGGTAPYTGTGTFTVGAGTYNYTVTDANGCTATTSITVSEPTLLTASSVQDAAILCNGGTTTVTVSAAGGTAPYTGTGTFTVGAGTYNYTVTDANGCTATTSITVSEPTLLTASSVQDAAILCNGGTTTVTVSAAGGTAPYTGTGTFTVGAGTYNYTVTDANGCTATTSITVSEPALVVASGSVTNVSCNGGTNGAIDLSVTGGSGSYTYLWSNSATTQDISGLAAGTYSVVITESNNCTVTGTVSFTVSEPTLLTAGSVQDAAILCNGGTTTVTVSAAGGTAPYTGTGTFTVGAGTYNYTVTDANGCTATTSITVSEPTLLTASSVQDAAILCNGGTTTVTVSAAGGTAPYTGTGTFTVGAGTYNYTVTDANGCTATTSITVSEPTLLTASSVQGAAILCNGGTTTVTVSASGGTAPYTGEGTFTVGAGTYNYTVTDANGCTATTSITVTEPALVVASGVVTNVSCNGGTTGSIDLTVTGGSGSYTYLWSNSATTQDISGLAAGTYNVVITESNNCTVTGTVSFTVTEPTLLTASSVQGAAILCNGGTTTVTVSASGGTAPYTGEGTFTVGAGTYNYTVTDANGCTATTSITVSEPTLLTASSVQGAAILCNGGTTTVTVSAAGGTAPYTGEGTFTVGAGTYNYTVTDANGCTATTSITVSEPTLLTASSTQGAAILCNGGTTTVTVSAAGGTAPYTGEGTFTVGAGTYNYTVTDANGCTATTSITVSEPTLLTASSVQGAAILCNGGTTTVTVSAAGGTAPYTGEGTFTVGAGTYNYTVTDANGCTATTSITVSEPTLLTASSVQGAAILCNGGTTTVTVSAAGGTAPYTGEGTFTVGAGTYNYTVTDANGCTATTSITVSEPTLLTASSVQGAAILCNGGTTTVTVSAAGGTAPYTGEGTFTVGAGTYNYTVTDANGCTATTSITVTEPALVVASGVVTNVSCNGGTTGSIDLTVTGGSGSYTYLWSNSATTQDISGLAAGTYNVVITESNNCTVTGTVSFTVTEPTLLTASSVQGAAILCNGGTTTVTVSASGGTAPYTGEGTFTVGAGTYNYTVTDANGCTATTSITVSEPTLLTASSVQGAAILCNGGTTTVTVSAAGGTAPYTGEGTFTVGAGTYNYTVTDANGCTATTSITVSEPTLLTASSTQGAAILCNGGTTTVTVSAAGGTAPYTGEGTFTVGAGTYNYTVTDANGCTATTSITVSEPTLLTASSVQGAAILCNGGTTTVTVSAAGGTAPYTGEGTFTVGAGTYNYTVTDANGCTATTSITVSEPTLLTASSVQGAAILCNGGTTTVTVSAAGGTAPYTGEGTFTVGAGTYNYTVTDANGCTATTSITVSEPTLLTASSTQGAAILCNGGTTTVTVSAAGGTAPYTGEGTFTVGAGTYNYTVTDANGCTATTSITVTEPALVVASGVVTNVSCNGGTTGSIDLTVTGGSGSYTYLWSNSATTQDISGLAAGTYSVVITESNNCTVTGTVSFTVTEATLVVASGVVTNVSCNGGTNGAIDLTVAGGSGSYTYLWSNGATTQDIIGLSAGNYSVVVTESNGCTVTGTVSFTVTEPALLVASSVQDAAILCNGGTTTVTVTAVGGTLPYTGTGTFTVSAGAYSFTVTDGNGCTATTTGTVTEPAAITSSASSTAIACNGGTSTLTIVAAGGNGSYTYTVNPGALVNTTGVFSGLTAGTYTWSVTDGNNCLASTGSETISQPALVVAPTVTLVNNGNGTATLTAGGSYTGPASGTLLWSTTETTPSITVSTPGTYTVTLTFNGCTSAPGSGTAFITSIADAAVGLMDVTDLANVPLNANTLVANDIIKLVLPVYNLNQDNAIPTGASTITIDLGTKIQLDPGFNLATAPLNAYFNWTSATVSGHVIITGSQVAAIPADFAENAVFQVQPTVFCSSSIQASFVIDNHASIFNTTDEDLANDNSILLYTVTVPAPTVSVTQPNCATATGTITVTAPTATGMTYSIDGTTYTNTTGVFTAVTPGSYNVTARTADGCTSAITIAVVDPQPLTPTITLGAVVNNTCHGGNTGSITVTAGVAPTPYTFTIAGPTVNTTGATTGVFTGLLAGNYTITVLSASGCSNSINAVVTEPIGTLPDISLGSDYDDNLFGSGSIGTEYRIVYNITEIAGNAATGDTLRLTRVAGYSFVFNGAATTATVGSTTYTLDNTRWKVDNSNAAFVSLILDPLMNNTAGTLDCGQKVYVMVSLKRNTANISTFSLSARLRKANGEVNLTNNLNSIVFTAE